MANRLSPVPSGPARLGGHDDVEQQDECQLAQETSLPNVPQHSFPSADMHERKGKANYNDSAEAKKIRKLGAWDGSSSARVQEILKKFDVQEGDDVKYEQVVSLLEHATSGQDVRSGAGVGASGASLNVTGSFMRWMMVLALLAVVVSLGAMTGLTWFVVSTIKDVQVGNANALVSKSTGEIVRTDVTDMQVVDGVLVGRAAYRQALEYATMANGAKDGKPLEASDTSVTWQRGGAVDPTSVGVLRTATFKGNRQRFSSRVDIEALMELNYVYIESGTGAQLALMVNGVARVPKDDSVWGSVVRIISSAGTLTLDDTIVHFSSDVAPIFAEAGFAVTSSSGARRRLLAGQYTLYGYFSSIQNITSFDPVDVSKPKLPTKDYAMQLAVFEPCTLPSAPTVDRCLYDPTGAAATGAAHHRRRELLATAAGSSVQPVDLPGTTIDAKTGERFMVHRRRITYLGKLVRSVSTYEATPGLQRVSVMDTGSGAVSEWQEKAHPDDTELDAADARGYCNSYTLPGEHLEQLALLRDLSAADFKYLGDEQKLGKAARHFTFNAKQPAALSGVTGADSISIEYWDTIDGFKPIAFELTHPTLGKLRYVVEDLKLAVTATSLAPSAFTAPKPEACTVGCMPRLGSAFSVPVPSHRWSELGAGKRRSLLSSESEHFHAQQHASRWLLADTASSSSAAAGSYAAAAAALCSAEPTALPGVSLGGSCAVTWGVRASKFVSVSTTCGPNGGALDKAPWLKLGGTASLDTCSATTSGCLLGSLSIPGDVASTYPTAAAVFNGLGSGAVGTLKLCGAIDQPQRQACMLGASASPASVSAAASWAGRVETYAALRYTTSAAWMSEAGFESYVGVNLGLFHAHHSVGAVDMARDTYFSGTAAAAKLVTAAAPSVVNTAVEMIRVGDVSYPAEYYAFVGYWGEWSSWGYCYVDAGAGSVRGIPVKGLRVRMDAHKPAPYDNTQLNAVELACSDGSRVLPASGLAGIWSDFATCSAGAYVTAARMRVADPASDGGDNSAANAVEFRCSDGAVLSPDQGYEGSWRDWVACPSDAFVCGVRLRIQPDQGDSGDNSAMNGMQLSCCRSGSSAAV
ncbi:hypothetical protein HYH02_003185 [Chlamydomonas schloesseri]|uniref:Uncharacterized protein n=1 Tax=Chlamydomonas schloesseri TaxID=2026947 RepID=A0A836BA50_9CHLO|nr:hypothetical protein HYH02_003185 [Chlamydomonas schloesseri]|eukprot:KAG2452153.1 hypothetical protein HYH02_003185 [Chlamydomonas schloesseri]